MNILIVEDENIVALDIESKLTSLNYTVIGISDTYEDTFELVKNNKVDLILLDVNIRGNKNGFDIAKTLKSDYSIPFVFLTSYSSNEFIEKIKSIDAYGYILKPYRIDDLISTIEIARTKFETEQNFLFQTEELNQIIKEKTNRLLQINKQLNKEIALRKKTQKDLVNSENTERKRIAMELHDGIGQKVTSAKFILGALSKRVEKDSLESELINEVKNTLNDVIQTIRNVSDDLTPPALIELGFEKAVWGIIEDLNFEKKVNVTFNYNTELDSNSVISKVIFRMIQEALNNAFKHSKCKNINIQIDKKGGKTNIIIKDDGIGFDLAKVTELNRGLYNMAYRCNLLNGNFHIDSHQNEGTKITITI